ncbi:MAG: acyltransferase [Chitinophagaceae bacterium]|nr:acyltransferase [Chitinophagaceae bacterium]MCA6478072.1 acyltransferase [Chitinophagaceae bacterium]MCA6491972.1 acyltransferase [Chitinophagaceae bacterium]MCA6511655.1 acyltransferase [Chitinophagaceae bacterium]
MWQALQERLGNKLSPADRLITVWRLIPFALRGLWEKCFMGKSSGWVLVGKQVSIRYAGYLEAGKQLIIEDYAEINARSTQKIILGNRVTIGKYAIIRPGNLYGGEPGEGLRVGDHSNIGPYCYIGCSGFISIGNNVMISPRVSIYAENHVFDSPDATIKSQGVKRESVVIEDDCWIAANSILLAGVTIGKGSVVAAGSVVTQDVPPYSVVAGVPARIIKNRRTDS